MGQVPVHVTLSNARELVMARLGHLAPEAVHAYEVEAVLDTEHFHCLVPDALTERLGLHCYWQGILQPDGSWGEGVVTEGITLELFGRPAHIQGLVMGERLHLSASVLGQIDLRYDEASGELRPNVGTWERPVFRV